MSESLDVPEAATKAEKYQAILPQIESLISSETDSYANIANIAAVLREAFGFFWVGFYIVKAEQLVLGPFQGPLACTRIAFGKGVCGTAWKEAKTQLVPDVDAFPGHIACSSLSKSEIVVPVIRNNKVLAVLDVDSVDLSTFDETDQQYLEEIIALIEF